MNRFFLLENNWKIYWNVCLLVGNGFIKVVNISVALSNEISKNTFNGSLLISPFVNVGLERSKIVSNANNFTVKSNDFNLSICNTFFILGDGIIVISDSFCFSDNFGSSTVLLVLEEVINNFDNFGNLYDEINTKIN